MMQSLFDNLPMAPRPGRITVQEPVPDKIEPFVTIVIEGEPVAKGRPRVRIMFMKGKPVPQLYAPKETQDYEDRIRRQARIALGPKVPPAEQPVGMLVRAFVVIPSSWSDKKKAAALRGEIFPLSRPDADNYLKMACDSLNGIIFRDDALVTDKHVIKRYSDQPRMEIEVYI